jgi:hypothetical protein
VRRAHRSAGGFACGRAGALGNARVAAVRGIADGSIRGKRWFATFPCFCLLLPAFALLCFAFFLCFSFLSFPFLCLALLSFFCLHLLVFAFALDNAQDNSCILLLTIGTKQLRNSSTQYRAADEDKQRLSAA